MFIVLDLETNKCKLKKGEFFATLPSELYRLLLFFRVHLEARNISSGIGTNPESLKSSDIYLVRTEGKEISLITKNGNSTFLSSKEFNKLLQLVELLSIPQEHTVTHENKECRSCSKELDWKPYKL